MRSRFVIDSINSTIFSGLGKASAAIIPFFVASWFLDTKQTDVFFFVNGIALLIYGLFSGTIETISIPFVTALKAKDEHFSSKVWKMSFILSLMVCCLGIAIYALRRSLLQYATSFDDYQIKLAGDMFLIMLPLVVFSTMNSILVSVFFINHEFKFSSLSSGFRAVIALATGYVLKDSLGILSIAAGYSIGEMLRAVFLTVLGRKRGYIQPEAFSIRLSRVEKKFLGTFFLNSIGMILVGLNPVITKSVASAFGTGSVSALEYSERIGMFPSVFIGLGTMNVLYVQWSHHYNEKDHRTFVRFFVNSNIWILFFLVAITITMALSRGLYLPIILPSEVLESQPLLYQLLLIFIASNIPYVIQASFVKVQFIQQEYKWFLLVQGSATLFYLFLANTLPQRLGLEGLAFGWFTVLVFLCFAYGFFFFKFNRDGSVPSEYNAMS